MIGPPPYRDIFFGILGDRMCLTIHEEALFTDCARRWMEDLSAREKTILTLRHGAKMSFEMIGQRDENLVTRERIRQILRRSERKLRHPARTRWLYPVATYTPSWVSRVRE
ncbi:hypothetical protein LCGC14_2186460 [marine sediment metagenome]|uniref:RNA polymerase sigma-70 region 4 domain-containing protein n=1 Tax=marine sediment metagenome TaxID=412755 RepID=A0A0F9E7X8_9ZZZZ